MITQTVEQAETSEQLESSAQSENSAQQETSAQENETREEQPVWQTQESGSTASLRGLHVVDQNIVWTSGTGGTVLKTVDGGETWTPVNVEGADELDFRDIHAWDENRAVIISAGTPARIYHTSDGGSSWTMAFEHADEKAFFDALSFQNETDGIVMSDPVDDRVLLIVTIDGGLNWTEVAADKRPEVIPGEAGFAASGTNMRFTPEGKLLIAMGGANEGEHFETSRILFSQDSGQTWAAASAPVPRTPSAGIFSMCFVDNLNGAVVGGDYLNPEIATGNAAVTRDGGATWSAPAVSNPLGYRSCVAAAVRTGGDVLLVAVGPEGTDVSADLGNTWSNISTEGFHSVQFTAPNSESDSDTAGWATGADGRIARWIMADQ